MTRTAPASGARSPVVLDEPRRAPVRQAFPVVLSAPSGAGKTSVARALLELFPNLRFAISCTTRAPRQGEVAGRDYEFLSEREFLERADAGDFVEWARVHGEYYGTPRAAIESALAAGHHVLLDVDVQGARSLVAEYPFAVTVFLLPPSLEVMRERLRARATEEEGDLRGRVQEAAREIARAKHYQYVLVNETLDETIELFEHILLAEQQRRSRIANWTSWIEAAYGVAPKGGKRG